MKLIFIVAALIVATNARLAAINEWTSFKATYNKSYDSVEEKVRFTNFQNNLRKIQEHNAKYEKGEVSYYFGINKFADWSQEEFKAMLDSQAANMPEINSIKKFEADPSFNVPDAIDWRPDAVLDVKDQGTGCISGWAFSATGSLEAQLAIHNKTRIPLSEQEFIDCNFRNGGCKGGSVDDAYRYVFYNGLSSESQYPYTGKDGECQEILDKPLPYINGFGILPPNEEELIYSIAVMGPVSVSVDASVWQLYKGGIYDNKKCGHSLNHVVLAVAYDNHMIVLKNSWGKSWGEEGFMRIQRKHNICGINEKNFYPSL